MKSVVMNPNFSQKKEEILQAARILFAKKGYDGFSLREVADACKLTKAGIYHHFKSKEEIFVEILKDFIEVLELIIVNAEKEPNFQKTIEKISRSIFELPMEKRAILRIARQDSDKLNPQIQKRYYKIYQEKFIKQLERIIRKFIVKKEIRNLDPGFLAFTLLGMMYPYFYYERDSQERKMQNTLSQILDVFFYGTMAR